MKKLLITFIAIIFISCASSKEEKAKKIIKEHLMQTLKDPSSYDPVSYEHLDSVFSPYIDTDEGRRLFNLGGITGEYSKKGSEYHNKAMVSKTRHELDIYGDSSTFYMEKAEEYEKLYKKNEKNYKGDFIGWIMKHKFRAKNSMGGLDFDEQYFYFDKDVTKITPAYGKTKD